MESSNILALLVFSRLLVVFEPDQHRVYVFPKRATGLSVLFESGSEECCQESTQMWGISTPSAALWFVVFVEHYYLFSFKRDRKFIGTGPDYYRTEAKERTRLRAKAQFGTNGWWPAHPAVLRSGWNSDVSD